VKLAGTPISDRSDGLLVREVKAGSTEAFNALVRRWERKVYSYLVYLTGQSEDAFDLVQEVFVTAYAKVGQLRTPETFRQWLFQIAHNIAYSHLRRERRWEAIAQGADPPSATPVVRLFEGSMWERAESRLVVERSLALLPREQREAIALKFYQGFKFDEIAAIQNCPVSTIKTRFYAGFDRLREILKPQGRQ
jgi:RNA polymerase sigma-70 factor (ECF subfamily)